MNGFVFQLCDSPGDSLDKHILVESPECAHKPEGWAEARVSDLDIARFVDVNARLLELLEESYDPDLCQGYARNEPWTQLSCA